MTIIIPLLKINSKSLIRAFNYLSDFFPSLPNTKSARAKREIETASVNHTLFVNPATIYPTKQQTATTRA